MILRPAQKLNARNSSMQYLASLLDRVVRYCKRAVQTRKKILQHPKMLQQEFENFQTWSNIIQHLATRCYKLAKRVPQFCAPQCCKMFSWNVADVSQAFIRYIYHLKNCFFIPCGTCITCFITLVWLINFMQFVGNKTEKKELVVYESFMGQMTKYTEKMQRIINLVYIGWLTFPSLFLRDIEILNR